MRNNPTEPEKRLWMELRDSRLSGHKFRRQAVIGARIVDFFCPAKGLVIEIDGDTHDPEVDARKDAELLRTHGFCTRRFTNPEVIRNMDGVLSTVLAALGQGNNRWAACAATTPRPPPLKRRGR